MSDSYPEGEIHHPRPVIAPRKKTTSPQTKGGGSGLGVVELGAVDRRSEKT